MSIRSLFYVFSKNILNSSSHRARIKDVVHLPIGSCPTSKIFLNFQAVVPYRNSTPFGYFDYKDISKGLAEAPSVRFLTCEVPLIRLLKIFLLITFS